MMKLSTDLWQNVEHVANIANFRSATEIYYLNLQLHSPLQVTPEDTQTDSNGPQSPSRQSKAPASLTDRKVLKSGHNGFGLFRQYFTARFPDHDPGEHITHNDLIESSNPSLPVDRYNPYPNLSSFLIGEWYWNGGEKKSQASFEQLMKIVGHPEFRPEDVAGNNWRLIDAQLSGERGLE